MTLWDSCATSTKSVDWSYNTCMSDVTSDELCWCTVCEMSETHVLTV